MINYALLTKPGIVMGNLLTVIAGYFLGGRGSFDLLTFLATFLGLALVMASACLFNNFIDRDLDLLMQRTKGRALARRAVSWKIALLFGTILGLIGFLTLTFWTNILTAYVALIGFVVYVCFYSFLKARTRFATAIGSIAGGVPPVVGYCAAAGTFDLGASLLFALMFFWQMPHFFAIAMHHLDDYAAANVPTLPLIRGIQATKLRMALYVFGFILMVSTLSLFAYSGPLTLFVGLAAGLYWLRAALEGFNAISDLLWARKMFRISLVAITALSLVIPLEFAML